MYRKGKGFLGEDKKGKGLEIKRSGVKGKRKRR